MSKPIIQIGNEQREMTDAEFAQWQADVAANNQESTRESAVS